MLLVAARPELGRHSTAAKGVFAMQFDKKSLDRLLLLRDDQLRAVLGKLLAEYGAEYGVDVSRVPLQQLDIGALRGVLQTATEEDVNRLIGMFSGGTGGGA